MIERGGKGNILVRLQDGFSRVGGGAMPLEEIRSRLLCISSHNIPVSKIESFFRFYNPPIIVRIEKSLVLIDLRTIQEKELAIVAEAIRELSQIQ